MVNSKSSARSELEKLVRYFEANIHQLKASSFNEAQARQQLIDPFFEALGWDVRNKLMVPPYRVEVIPEGRVRSTVGKALKDQAALFDKSTALKEEQAEYASMLEYIAEDEFKADQKVATKKPDYRFRLQGSTKFFVEAKKPAATLINNLDAIFQVKRYGFSARVPVSILTDFEEFRVFDCTRKPFYDKPKVGVLKEFDLTYRAYLDEFERLYDTFSREAVVTGSIEALQKKYLEKRTGEFALDRSFLEDLSQWRVELAQDIAKHPKNRRILNTYTLNECVQRILDRIVFLRVCEDRNIEIERTLLELMRVWQDHPGISLYQKLNELINQRRSLYNGLLFAEHECEQVEVSNKILEKIFRNINYPLSPYHFDEIGVEILGSIYERFLGKTIRLTQKQVRVDDKPEVRKAGGVYYTPQYIVDYIVDNTVGKLLYDTLTASFGHTSPTSGRGDEGEGKKLKLSPKQVSKLKIIDIACGSGSFLLGAFQKLIDYHIEWYTHHPEDIKEVNGVRDAYEDPQGRLVLSARKKREILVNNIYGVDIDQQAVEVTQMSLYLKVLEDENDATLNKPTMLALHEVLLPPLKNNIKCGNSLVGMDFFAQGELFDDEARRKVNAFDWEIEFPEITKNGGFDVVIGNPPYVRIQTMQETAPELIPYLGEHYRSAVSGNYDIYVAFLEKGLSLLNVRGRQGFIVPHKFFNAKYGQALRALIADGRHLSRVVHFGDQQVFDGATTYTCLLFLEKGGTRKCHVVKVNDLKAWREKGTASEGTVGSDGMTAGEWNFAIGAGRPVFEKLSKMPVKLENVTSRIFQGIKTSADSIYILEERKRTGKRVKVFCKQKGKEYWLELDLLHPLIKGGDSRRYHLSRTNRVILFPYARQEDGAVDLIPESVFKRSYPLTWAYLLENKSYLENREDGKMRGPKWYGYVYPKALDVMGLPKIFTPDLAAESSFSLDETGELFFSGGVAGGYGILVVSEYSREYILALLNSKPLQWIIRQTATQMRGGYFSYESRFIRGLPIRAIDFTNAEEKKMHDDLVALVDKMLDLHKQLHKASFESEKEPIKRQIAATDKKIDELVYRLYGLTEEEIRIVEGKG